MNHNVNGYYGDQNPLKIDGKYDPVATGATGIWSDKPRSSR